MSERVSGLFRLFVLGAVLVASGCASPEEAFVKSSRSFHSAVAPEYQAYVEADEKLTAEQKNNRLRTLRVRDRELREYEQRLKAEADGRGRVMDKVEAKAKELLKRTRDRFKDEWDSLSDQDRADLEKAAALMADLTFLATFGDEGEQQYAKTELPHVRYQLNGFKSIAAIKIADALRDTFKEWLEFAGMAAKALAKGFLP